MENRARSSKVEAVMRAIRVNEFGGPPALVLENLVDPVPTGDEVLVRLSPHRPVRHRSSVYTRDGRGGRGSSGWRRGDWLCCWGSCRVGNADWLLC